MAKIVDHILYQERLHQYVIEAGLDYGRKTARRWIAEIEKIRKFVKVFPEGKPPFDGAPDFPYQLRGANFMNNFKLIYYYSEDRDEVHFLDIWDMRKNPSSFWSIDEEKEAFLYTSKMNAAKIFKKDL